MKQFLNIPCFFFFLMFSYFNKVKDLLKLFFSHQRACYVISFVPKLLLIFRLCLQKNLLPFRSYIKLLFLVNYCDGGEVNFIYLFSPLCYTFQHTSLQDVLSQCREILHTIAFLLLYACGVKALRKSVFYFSRPSILVLILFMQHSNILLQ